MEKSIYTEEYQRLCALLRELRREAGLTQVDVADRLEVPQSFAHVDPKLERFYEELMQGEWGLGLTGDMTYDGPPPFEQGVTQYANNGHLALIRVFAHEVLATADRFQWAQSSVV
ncbi:helix-turn-helix domain-containing protein [Mycolicibacterium llatzerense]|uniref:helix-turn-helix domain-containing protein n=1 Tax=Mycolicibacterium llatzerense TaxID=280871 RepID=UPI001F1AB664|nr:helix-turn-helix transcriptional regulator [Mycolicibacterium llatzerense]